MYTWVQVLDVRGNVYVHSARACVWARALREQFASALCAKPPGVSLLGGCAHRGKPCSTRSFVNSIVSPHDVKRLGDKALKPCNAVDLLAAKRLRLGWARVGGVQEGAYFAGHAMLPPRHIVCCVVFACVTSLISLIVLSRARQVPPSKPVRSGLMDQPHKLPPCRTLRTRNSTVLAAVAFCCKCLGFYLPTCLCGALTPTPSQTAWQRSWQVSAASHVYLRHNKRAKSAARLSMVHNANVRERPVGHAALPQELCLVARAPSA